VKAPEGQLDYVFDKQLKSQRLTDAFLGALPSRRRADGEMLCRETRRRNVSRRVALTRQASDPKSLYNSPPEKIA
jgi:hypothetical protein